MNKIWQELNRGIAGIVLLVVLALLLWLIPDSFLDPNNIDAKAAMFATLLISAFKVVEGFLIGHIMRKTLMCYIDFNKETEWSNNAMVLLFYALAVWGCVVAG